MTAKRKTPGPEPAFDKHAASYDADLQRGLALSGENKEYFARKRIEHIRRRLDNRGVHPKTVVDYGCGDGSSTPLLYEILEAERVIGVDTSTGLLARANTTYGSTNTHFQTAAAPIRDKSVDLVYCNGVFHHMDPDDRPTALATIHHTLTPHGHFAFWENNPWNPGTRWVMRRIPFDRDAITITPPEGRRLLETAGFDVVASDFLFVFPRWLRWLRPLERRIMSWPIGAQYLHFAEKPG